MIADMLLGLFARINLLRSWSMSLPARSAESAREMRQLYLGIQARDANEGVARIFLSRAVRRSGR